MQLTSRSRRRPGRRRLADERGAIAVMVALLMVPMLGFAAIAVDVSSLYSDKEQLRTAADAAALAIANDCAKGACGNTTATATSALTANAGAADRAGATLRTPTVSIVGQKVTVTVSADQTHWFASALGIASTTVTVTSAATWTVAAPLTRTLRAPVGLSWCEYQAQVARGSVLNGFAATSTSTPCTGPAGESLRGGQSVLQPDSVTTCLTVASTGSNLMRVRTASQAQVDNNCASGRYRKDLIGDEVSLPVWTQTTTSGGDTLYRVYGFVTFEVWSIDFTNATPSLTGRLTSALAVGGTGAGSVSLVREQ